MIEFINHLKVIDSEQLKVVDALECFFCEKSHQTLTQMTKLRLNGCVPLNKMIKLRKKWKKMYNLRKMQTTMWNRIQSDSKGPKLNTKIIFRIFSNKFENNFGVRKETSFENAELKKYSFDIPPKCLQAFQTMAPYHMKARHASVFKLHHIQFNSIQFYWLYNADIAEKKTI